MAEILLVNEAAKLRAVAGAGGGGATQYSGSDFTVSTAVFPAHTTGNNYYTAGPAGWAEHGGGQFSVSNAPWVSTSNSQAFQGIRPFTVNQSNGSISVGSYNSYSTTNYDWYYGNSMYGVAGSTVNRWDVGLSGSWRGNFRQFNVSGNSVSASSWNQTSGTQPVWSNPIIPLWNGSTLTWIKSGYNDNNGQAMDFRWTGIGTSISFPSTSTSLSPSTNTSTQNISRIITNFGAAYKGASIVGTLRFYRDSNGNRAFIHVLNNGGSVVNSYATGDVIGSSAGASTFATGIDLSNGRQLYYTNTGSVILRDGSTLSDVTSQADWVPNIHFYSQSGSFPVQSYVALSNDKWMMVSYQNPQEVIVFSINPTTYKVNIQATALVTTGSAALHAVSNASTNGTFITGNTNQYLVFCMEDSDRYSVTVTNNPLAGVV